MGIFFFIVGVFFACMSIVYSACLTWNRLTSRIWCKDEAYPTLIMWSVTFALFALSYVWWC